MRLRTTAALFVVVPAVLAGQAPVQVDTLKISAPTTVKEIDTDKAQPSRLAWSADGSQLYVQTFEGTFLELNQGTAKKIKHYVFTAADGRKEDVRSEPEWARAYWSAKSGQASPDAALKIDWKEDVRTEKTTSVPRGGDLARGGTVGDPDGGAGGTSAGDATAAAMAAQRVKTISLLLKGETIGKFENTVMVAGLTFGWAPKGAQAIAFASQRGGRVVLMDAQGRKHEVAGSRDAVLPAWSPDGTQLAWLQKEGKKKYLLQLAAISGS